jgi:hypothetical protein
MVGLIVFSVLWVAILVRQRAVTDSGRQCVWREPRRKGDQLELW